MAGLEIAGAILGGIPLIISALEHYSDSFERIEGIWNFRQTFDDLRTDFLTYMSVFNDMSRDLLRQHLGSYYAELNLEQLMDHQLGTYKEWIAQRLREGLGVSVYQVYEKLVRRLNKRLVLLQGKLGLAADGSVPFLTGDIIDEEQHRHFFEMWWRKPLWASVRARNFRKLVKEIKAEIEKIEKVTSSGRSEIVIRKSAKQSKGLHSPCDKYWLALRDHTMSLYVALHSAWPPASRTISQRQAQILIGMPDKANQIPRSTGFHLALEFENTKTSGPVSSDEPNNVLVLWKRESPSQVLEDIVVCSCPEQRHITDLQEDILQPKKGDCFGVLKDGALVFHLHPTAKVDLDDSQPLSKVLIMQQRRLLYKRRCEYALGLAAAVLQFHDTPWLPRTWSMADVFCLTKPDLKFHLSSHFVSDRGEECMESEAPRAPIKNSWLFRLGISLIELAFGQELSKLLTDSDLVDGPEGNYTRFQAAYRLMMELAEGDMPGFAAAVEFCIDPHSKESSQIKYSLRNEAFRENFYLNVVCRLRDEVFGQSS